MKELLPCPFCGSEARHYAPGPIDHHIECVNYKECGADIARDTEAEAIAAWNTRAEQTCKQVLIDCDDGLIPPFTAHCSACGDEWGFTPNYCPNCGAKVIEQ